MKQAWKILIIGLIFVTVWNLCVLFLIPPKVQSNSIEGKTIHTCTYDANGKRIDYQKMKHFE